MHSPLLALFGRSLREDVRLKMTYFARAGLVLVILLFLLTVSTSFGWGNAPGLSFFGTVIFINFCFIVLAGLSYFASAITEEKEEMTLGLLRMTNLDPLSILLGKSTSRLVGAMLLLIAQFPFTLLAVSLGGVAIRQIVAAYCTLGAFIVFLANLALLASVICRRTTGAAVFTGILLFGFFAVVPFIRWVAVLPGTMGLITTPSPGVGVLNKFADGVSLASPINRLTAIFRTGFSGDPLGVQVWSDLALGAGCFLLAWAVFEVFCSEQQEATQPRSLVPRRTSRLRAFGAGRVWKRALAWKDFHFLVGGKGWMGIKFLVYAVPPILAATVPHLWGGTTTLKEFGYFTFWMSFVIGGFELAFIAASVLRRERQWKTLSSLAMLPMSMRQIAYQKVFGCVPALIPALSYMGLGLLCASADFGSWSIKDWTADGVLAVACTVLEFATFLHLVAWLSLYLRRGALSVGIAVYFVANAFIGIFVGLGSRNADVTLLSMLVFCFFAVIVLHVLIGPRLEALAEED